MTVRLTLRRAGWIGLAGLLTGLLGGCPEFWNPTSGKDTPSPAALKAFNSASDMLTYFQDQARETSQYRSNYSLLGFFAAAPTAGGLADTSQESGDDSSNAFSTTNVQEAGVDECDVFKSDGEYFYIAHGKELEIVKPSPLGEMAEW